jgi:hypothetical protein
MGAAATSTQFWQEAEQQQEKVLSIVGGSQRAGGGSEAAAGSECLGGPHHESSPGVITGSMDLALREREHALDVLERVLETHSLFMSKQQGSALANRAAQAAPPCTVSIVSVGVGWCGEAARASGS